MSALSLLFALNITITAQAASTYLKPFEKPVVLQGSFEQVKKIKDLEISIETSGTFRISRESANQVSIYWHILKPEPMKVCIDQGQLVFLDLTSQKKTTLKLSEINSQDSSGLSKLIHLFKLDPNEVTKDFKIENQKNGLKLTPLDKKNFAFQSAELEFDSLKNLKKVVVTEMNQDSLEIRFIKTKQSKFDPKKVLRSDCT